jgi:hypothetical protein
MTDTTPSATNNEMDNAPAPLAVGTRDDARARAILRGTQRLLRSLNFESLSEVSLGNGRRADVLALSRNGTVWIVEIKSSIADFRADQKWHEYRDYCDALLFAVAPDFPAEILPFETGLILADSYGGELLREAPSQPIGAARRKALTLSFGRTAAMRLLSQVDPGAKIE